MSTKFYSSAKEASKHPEHGLRLMIVAANGDSRFFYGDPEATSTALRDYFKSIGGKIGVAERKQQVSAKRLSRMSKADALAEIDRIRKEIEGW